MVEKCEEQSGEEEDKIEVDCYRAAGGHTGGVEGKGVTS
jgi:hypothetical protein